MLNYIWLGLVLLAVLLGGSTGKLASVTDGAITGASHAVTLAIGLIGVMALWLGMMRLAEKSGLVYALARGLRPLLRWLFPEVPEGHPALGSIIMNVSANMLGLLNAATPLGLRAMRDLERLNPHPGVATNAMCTFLAINTSSVQLVPITAIAVLAQAHSANPTAIVGTAFLATLCSSIAAILAVKSLQRLKWFRIPVRDARRDNTPARLEQPGTNHATAASPDPTGGAPETTRKLTGSSYTVLALFAFSLLVFLTLILLDPQPQLAHSSLFVRLVNGISILAIPFLLAFFPLYATLKGVPVYEEFVQGAKEGFQVAVSIIPFLVAMLVAIGMFREAGGIELLTQTLRPVLDWLHFPAEILPMTLIRPLTGTGTLAIFGELVQQYGPDSLIDRTAGTLFGSTETTFYVLVVYFGSVGIHRVRHALAAGLIADAVGVIASVIICNLVFG